jgi:hypothetical protein
MTCNKINNIGIRKGLAEYDEYLNNLPTVK